MRAVFRLIPILALLFSVQSHAGDGRPRSKQSLFGQTRSASCLAHLYGLKESVDKTVEAVQRMRSFLTKIQTGSQSRGSVSRVNVSETTPFGFGLGAAERRLIGLEEDNRSAGKSEESPTFLGTVITGADAIRDFEERILANHLEIKSYRSIWFTLITLFNRYWMVQRGLHATILASYGVPAWVNFVPNSVFSIWVTDINFNLIRNSDFSVRSRRRRDVKMLDEKGPRWSLWSDSVIIPPKLLDHENLQPKGDGNDDVLDPLESLTNFEINPTPIPFIRFTRAGDPEGWTLLSIDRLLQVDEDGVPELTLVARFHPVRPHYRQRVRNTEGLLELIRGYLRTPGRASFPVQ
jgi:hypothetical protein